MALQKQNVNINFSMGLDTKTDPWQIDLGKFLELENMVFTTGKQLKKRKGFDALGIDTSSVLPYSFQAFGAALTSGSFCNVFNDELVVSDGYNLFSYSDSDDKVFYKGRAVSSSLASQPVYQNQYNQIGSDSAINLATGLTAYAWEEWNKNPSIDGTQLRLNCAVFDTQTHQQLYKYGLSATDNSPKCVAIGNNLYVIYFDSVTNELKALALGSTGPGATTVLITDIDPTNPNYDIMVNGSLFYIGYNAVTPAVNIKSYNSALALQASATEADAASNGVGLFSDASNNVWCAYNNSAATKAFIYNQALSVQVLAPTIVDNSATSLNVSNVTGAHDGTYGVILYDQHGVPALGQYSGVDTSAIFVQPAVNGSTLVTSVSDVSRFVGQIIYIENGGYYYVESYIIGGFQAGIMNLGYVGNAAPGVNIPIGSKIYVCAGNINALTSYNTLTAAGAVGTVGIYVKSAALASKAFLNNGFVNAIVSYDSLIQPTYFLATLFNILPNTVANLSAKIFMSESGGLPYRSILPSVNVDSLSVYNVTLQKRVYSVEKTENNQTSVIWFNGVFNSQINLSPTQVSSQELGKTLIIGSGNTLMYDGVNVVEQGFNIYPENITATYGAGTGLLSAGQYGYQIVYQWIDANGLIYKSAPSIILSVTAAAGNASFALSIPTLRLTEKLNVTITIYRTAANGTVYYRVDPQYVLLYPINNNTLLNTITIVDVVPDSSIIGNEQLYTTGEVENISVPGTSVITNYKNRAIALPYDSVNSFWYSKQIIPGSPVEFSDLFVQNVDSVGGNIVTLAPMDDKLVIYKESSIYYMVGNGPAPSGANNDFVEPLLVTTDVGCVDKASVVRMPMGHMFKSTKGIYLLDRSLQARFIGADVNAYNGLNVLTAKLIDKSNQVRFSLSDGTVVCYDYFYGQWDIFPSMGMISSCLFNEQQTFIKVDGSLFKESLTGYQDGANPVLMKFVTGWINIAGLQGFERAFFFFFLGKYISPHSLTIGISYDYDDAIAQTLTITPDSAESVEQWRVFLNKQKCEAFKLTVQENYTGTPGAGLTLSGLDLTIGVKDGRPRLKAARSAS